MLRWAEEVSLFFYGSCTAARTTAEGGALDNFRPDPAIRPPGSGSYEWDLRIGRWQMSAELRSVYGLSQAPGHPEELLQIVHPDDRDHVRSEMARARKATGRSWDPLIDKIKETSPQKIDKPSNTPCAQKRGGGYT